MKNKNDNSDKNYFDSLYNSYSNATNNWNYDNNDVNNNHFKYFNVPTNQNIETSSIPDNSLNIFENNYFQNADVQNINVNDVNKNEVNKIPEIIDFQINEVENGQDFVMIDDKVSMPEIIDDIEINNNFDTLNEQTDNEKIQTTIETFKHTMPNNTFDNVSKDNNLSDEEPEINEQFFNSWGNVSSDQSINNVIPSEGVTPKTKSKLKFRRSMRGASDKGFIQFIDVGKTYKSGETTITALHDVNFTINKGELVVILGSSGAGKSTALNALGGMDVVTSGKVIVDGKDIAKYSLEDLTDYRRKVIGFVFQFYNLVQNLTVKENVELATDICKDSIDAIEILEKVGLKERVNNFPSQLSGGEQQRASIARAIAKKPKILLCDEPTGALDYKNGKQILKLLQDTCYESGITEVIITHNAAISPMADRVITFKSGTIVEIKENPNPVSVEDIEW